MSGVKNLRAMFENRGENNPPDRGRSPGPGGFSSVGSPSPSHSPRPLSKVRTTFVAVEKDGRVGLRREHSGDSISVSSRRLSNDTEATTPQPAPEKADPFIENMAKNHSSFKTNLSQEAIPESPKLAAPSNSSSKEAPSPNLAPNSNPDKITDEEETKTRLLPGNPTDKVATRGNSTSPGRRTKGSVTNGKPKATAATKPPPKTIPISTSAKSVSKAPKSPNSVKPAPANMSKASANAPSLVPQKKATPASKDHDAPKKTAASATAKTAAAPSKKPTSIDLPPSGSAFAKPKPKSPTRPVKLPASLTAPTAAYASKLGPGSAAHPPRQSLSRASGNAQHLNVGSTLHRSSSRASISAAGSAASNAAKGLKRQSSTISRPRPSLGPPPKPAAKDHPVSKKDNHVDEGFLARMMRPTQSSSSKTSEKAPATPPRKQSAPITTAVAKKPATKDAEGSAKKAAAKILSSTNKAKAAAETTKPVDKDVPTAKEVALVVAQTETAEAAVETAKVAADTAVAPVAEKKEPEAVEPTAAEGKKEIMEESIEESVEPAATVPAITEDPAKLEDIEDVVQEAIPEPAGKPSFAEELTVEPVIAPATAIEEEFKEPEAEESTLETNAEPTVSKSQDNATAEEHKVEGEQPELADVEVKTETAEETTKEEAPEVEDVETHKAKSEIPASDA